MEIIHFFFDNSPESFGQAIDEILSLYRANLKSFLRLCTDLRGTTASFIQFTPSTLLKT